MLNSGAGRKLSRLPRRAIDNTLRCCYLPRPTRRLISSTPTSDTVPSSEGLDCRRPIELRLGQLRRTGRYPNVPATPAPTSAWEFLLLAAVRSADCIHWALTAQSVNWREQAIHSLRDF